MGREHHFILGVSSRSRDLVWLASIERLVWVDERALEAKLGE
jgi:hypothetical protein